MHKVKVYNSLYLLVILHETFSIEGKGKFRMAASEEKFVRGTAKYW
jgi:hypothetical protein